MLSSSQGTKTQPLPEDTLDPRISSNPTMHIPFTTNQPYISIMPGPLRFHSLLVILFSPHSKHPHDVLICAEQTYCIDRLAKNNNKRIVYPASICLTKQPHVVLPSLLGLSPPRRRLGYTYELTHFSHFNYQAQMGLKKQNKKQTGYTFAYGV